MSNVCHVVQRTTATNKSSYKCVRVEFTEPEGNNRKVRPPTMLMPHFTQEPHLRCHTCGVNGFRFVFPRRTLPSSLPLTGKRRPGYVRLLHLM